MTATGQIEHRYVDDVNDEIVDRSKEAFVSDSTNIKQDCCSGHWSDQFSRLRTDRRRKIGKLIAAACIADCYLVAQRKNRWKMSSSKDEISKQLSKSWWEISWAIYFWRFSRPTNITAIGWVWNITTSIWFRILSTTWGFLHSTISWAARSDFNQVNLTLIFLWGRLDMIFYIWYGLRSSSLLWVDASWLIGIEKRGKKMRRQRERERE